MQKLHVSSSVAKKLMIVAAMVLIMSVITKFWMFNAIVELGVKDQTALRKRNEIRDIYLKIPFPLDFKIFLFNVTNPMDIQNGSTPIVKEIGPYWYDEYIEKIDVVDNDREDSLTYTPKHIFRFNPNKSGSLRDDDYVTIVHPVLVGMVNQVLINTPVFISFVNQSIPDLFNHPQSIFLTAKVKDIMFDGVEINCTTKNFPAAAVCQQLKSQIPGIKSRKDNEFIYLFSLLGSRNGTYPKRLKVLKGITNSRNLGRLVEIDGKKEINLWGTTECNRFNGTDGWIFPPLLSAEEGLRSFSADLCRNMKLHFVNDAKMKNLKVRLYETDLGDQSTNDEDKCYCRTPEHCLKKGLFDMNKCLGAPIIASLPHFLKVDESYLEQIEGLEPDDAKHGLRAYFEPMTGSPVEAYKRIQFNLELIPTNKSNLFNNLPNALVPLFWIEESVSLEGDLLKKIQSVFLLLRIADYIIIFVLCCSIAVFFAAVYAFQKNRKEISITPVYDIKRTDGLGSNSNLAVTDTNNTSDKNIGKSNSVLSGHEFDRY